MGSVEIQNLFSFEGTLKRQPFLIIFVCSASLATATTVLIIYSFGYFVANPEDAELLLISGNLTILLIFLTSTWIHIAISIRRCRDCGISPNWVVALLVPVINIWVFGTLLFAKSKPSQKANANYGKLDPSEQSSFSNDLSRKSVDPDASSPQSELATSNAIATIDVPNISTLIKPEVRTAQDTQEKKMNASEDVRETSDRWDLFVSYSSIADEIISSLWEKGVSNYYAYDYLKELRKFVLSKDKITETKREIIDTVVENTDSQHKVSEIEDIQLLYQKVRSADLVKAEELKGVIEFLGNGADIKKLTNNFDVDETKFPAVSEIDLTSFEKMTVVEEKANGSKQEFQYKGYEIKLNSSYMYEVFERGEIVSSTTQFLLPEQAKAYVDQLLFEMSSNY